MNFLTRIFRPEPAPVRVEPAIAASEIRPSGTSDPETWFSNWAMGGGLSTQLPRVAAVRAEKHALVMACCSIIAGDLAKLPLKLYRKDDQGHDHEITDHPAVNILNKESSPGVTAHTFRFSLAYFYALRGSAFAYAQRDGRGDLDLVDFIHPDIVTILRDGRARFYEFRDGADIFRRVDMRQMVHLRHMPLDGWTGRSPIEVACETMGLAQARHEAAGRAASGTTKRVVLKLAERQDNSDQRERRAQAVREQFIRQDSGVIVLDKEDDLKNFEASAADRELIESQKIDAQQIRAIYRVPPFKLQDDSGVKSNSSQQAVDYLSDCLTFWGKPIEQQLALSLLTEDERASGLKFNHEYKAMLRSTPIDQAEVLKIAVGGPWMTPGEAQRITGSPITPDSDVLYPPPNMTRAEKPGPKSEDDDEK